MFKSITVYKLLSRVPSLAVLEDALAADAFEPCGSTQEKSIGWQPPREQEHGAFVESVGGQAIARLVIETRAVPASAVKQKVKDEVAEIEAQTGRKPGKKERRDLADDARISLLPHAFPKQCAVTVWIDPKAGYLVLDNTTQGRLDDVITALIKAIRSLQVSLINTNNHFSHNVVLVKKCVVRHYAQLTFPVPAVIVVTLNPPDGAGVEPVRPAPIVIVKLSGYFKITTPDPPAFAAVEGLPREEPPPPPVFGVPAVPTPTALPPPPVPPDPPVPLYEPPPPPPA